jgi:hypothetical protein
MLGFYARVNSRRQSLCCGRRGLWFYRAIKNYLDQRRLRFWTYFHSALEWMQVFLVAYTRTRFNLNLEIFAETQSNR